MNTLKLLFYPAIKKINTFLSGISIHFSHYTNILIIYYQARHLLCKCQHFKITQTNSFLVDIVELTFCQYYAIPTYYYYYYSFLDALTMLKNR